MKIKKLLSTLAVTLVAVASLTSCLNSDDDDNSPYISGIMVKGVYVLNCGWSGSVDGTLSKLTYPTTTGGSWSVSNGVFQSATGMSLGDNPNDIMIYGDKIYITATNENTLWVLNKKTLRTLAQIRTTELAGDDGASPRCLQAAYGDVYVSTYGTTTGSVLRIDTLSYALKGKYGVGSYPENFQVASTDESNVYLYVANSNYGNGDGNMSFVTCSSNTTQNFTIDNVTNPVSINGFSAGIYVLNSGYYDADWAQRDAGIYLLGSIRTDNASAYSSSKVVDATMMATITGTTTSRIYYINNPYKGTDGISAGYFEAGSAQITKLTLSGLNNPCAMDVDPVTGYLYVACTDDYSSYYVNVYSVGGTTATLVESGLKVGISPVAFAFDYDYVWSE